MGMCTKSKGLFSNVAQSKAAGTAPPTGGFRPKGITTSICKVATDRVATSPSRNCQVKNKGTDFSDFYHTPDSEE